MALGAGHKEPMPGPVSLTAYVGIPYARNARADLAAADCWGLVRQVYARELGIDLPIYGEADSGSLAAAAKMVRGVAQGHPWRAVDNPADFDVVLMRHGLHSRHPGHVGLWFGGLILHSLAGTNSALVRPSHHSVSWRILGYRRHADIGPDRIS